MTAALLFLALLTTPAQDAGPCLDPACAQTDVVLPVMVGPTQEEPERDGNGFLIGDPTNALDLLDKAVTTRNYFFGAAAVLMLLTVWIRRRWSAIPPDLVPAVTLILTAVPALVLVLMRPGVNVTMVVKQIFVLWLMTGGAWEAIGKRLVKVWWPRWQAAFQRSAAPAPVAPAAPAAPPSAAPVEPPAAGPVEDPEKTPVSSKSRMR